ncbi:hypothetical protein HO133_006095 [Letharia lupina]|uniref:Uncharacterized protein n=1 Tax=Letharia lupina TaxID=560253 RepID=A0A8H6F7S1_9LECA|nr:uncharacterized protein HO133_006095 [Letharia lupina]KAF6218136.1 hypothetical protein HO133_006095 [Letharia lupina]
MAALSSMCVRAQGKGGKAFGLGLRKNIFIQISDEHPDLSRPAANVANVSASAALLGLEASNAYFELNEPKWAPSPSVEVSTDILQGSSSSVVVRGDVNSDSSED